MSRLIFTERAKRRQIWRDRAIAAGMVVAFSFAVAGMIVYGGFN